MRGMPLARTARDRLEVEPADPVATSGFGPDLAATRRLAAKVVEVGEARGVPASAGELAAIGLLHEILHRLTTRLAQRDPRRSPDVLARQAATDAGVRTATAVRTAFDREFPNAATGEPLSELLLVRVANENPAASPYRWLFDDRPVIGTDAGARLLAALEAASAAAEAIGPGGESLLELLRAPARAAPTSLAGQLRYVRDRWRGLLDGDLDDLLDRATLLLDVIAEEERGLHLRFGGATGGPSGVEAPGLGDEADPERFSMDRDWMPRLVMIAKSTYVWLDQLSKRHGRDIRTLDVIPDEELDRLARWGVSGLWLIGLWQRSRASERVKRLRGNPDAVASAYSLDDYRIADDLGGEAAWADLAGRAWQRGIRLASDMVPNHMGIDSRWVIEHPDRFLSLPQPPYPAYSYRGPDLSDDERVAIRIEDHYWEGTDAAVVFQRVDTHTGDVRYVYHGNDGTSMPWNDTAQLDYSRAEVREAVIRTIIEVARRFPIIRFDAAMTLAKRHVQRLWFPTPGAGGAIPSRAEHAMPREAFDAAMPVEFWREVVDRVAAEAPDTLLLAEAFWLMEGYFVRTLGMHRVYNSAFMHMLRDEDGAGFKKVLRDTLEFDPEILKRYVNFMSNPDEKTAVEQFGKGDKYFGVATVLATLPGLPMLGHGQVEGYAEKYGMEYRRAYHDESPDEGLVAAHERWLFPLLHRRAQFAEVRDFLLYDLVRDDGSVDDQVLAYSNGSGPTRSLVIYHLRYGETVGTIQTSVPYSVRDGSTGEDGRRLIQRTLAEAWRLGDDPAQFIRARDLATGMEHLWRASGLREPGLRVELGAYERRVLVDVDEVLDDGAGLWTRLHDRLAGGGVPSLDRARRELELTSVHRAVGELVGDLAILGLVREGRAPADGILADQLGAVSMEVREATGGDGEPAAYTGPAARRLAALGGLAAAKRGELPVALTPVASALGDPTHRGALAGWALLASLGGLARAAPAAPLARSWYRDLLLGPVVAGALRSAGLSEDRAERTADRIGTLIDLARPSTVGDDPEALLDAWLGDDDARIAIGWNEWDGAEYVARDGWRELLDWALLIDAVDGADVPASAGVVHALADAGETAGYRIDTIRDRLAPRLVRRTDPADQQGPP